MNSSSSPSKPINEEAHQGIVDIKGDEQQQVAPMEEDDSFSPATVFQIKLKQTPSNLIHKMNVPGLCRKFSATAWCGKLNVIACASETCARIPSSNTRPPFWIPIHIVNPERPTESAVFNVTADSPCDSVQFIEWSPASCARALLVANLHGRITIWTQPYNGPTRLVLDFSFWKCEHEWCQDVAVVTKWLSGFPSYSCVSLDPRSPASSKSTFEEGFFSQRPLTSARWPDFLCICSVLSSGSVQLHWAEWPNSQTVAAPKWFCTRKAMLGAGPSGIMAADVIITEAGTMYVAGVPIVNPSTVVVWEVTPGTSFGYQASALLNTSAGVPPSLDPPRWTGYAPLAAYLFSWQEYFVTEANRGNNEIDTESCEAVDLHCSPVSNFSAYVSPEAAAQSAATTTWGSGVTAVAFDPTRGGTVLSVVIVEGQYMSPYDPNAGPSITSWKIQCWESSYQSVVLHPIFGNPESDLEGKMPMQTVWLTKVNRNIPSMNETKSFVEAVSTSSSSDKQNVFDSIKANKMKRFSFDPLDLPSNVRTLARIVYSAHGGDVAVSFLNGGVHIFLGANFAPVYNYIGDVSAIAAPTFSSTGCCLASVWHDTSKDLTILKIIRLLPPGLLNSRLKVSSATWERAIADRFWWSLMVGVDWWDVVGCTQSAVEDDIVSLNNVIAELDADFHSLSSCQHREQHRPSLDRLKCRLLEGTNAQEVRAMVLDMQARLLLDMLGKGVELALMDPGALISEPWLAPGEVLSGIGPDALTIEPGLVSIIQGYVDAILDLTSHFITWLRRYVNQLARRTVGINTGVGSGGNTITSCAHSSASSSTSQGQGGATSSTGSSQMQAWMQNTIAKISSSTDCVSDSADPMPGTSPGIPAVRLIGDCHFLHRLCQLVLFCYFFWQRHLLRNAKGSQNDDSTKKETNTASIRPASGMPKAEEVRVSLVGAKGAEEGPRSRSQRLGDGNAGHGYTYEEVKSLLHVLIDLCRRTSGLSHPFPSSQVGNSNAQIRLHYTDGNYTVLPEVLEASISQYIQQITPRPRGADAAGLLLRALELNPPSEDWQRRNMFGGLWSDTEDLGPLRSSESFEFDSFENVDSYYVPPGLWPKKRRFSERDAAFGLRTSEGLGQYLGLMGSRRDVLTAKWRRGLEGVWYKCIRCLRQTSAFSSLSMENGSVQNDQEAWWISRWSHCCPMCSGAWIRVG